jgi:hypothetical protein
MIDWQMFNARRFCLTPIHTGTPEEGYGYLKEMYDLQPDYVGIDVRNPLGGGGHVIVYLSAAQQPEQHPQCHPFQQEVRRKRRCVYS